LDGDAAFQPRWPKIQGWKALPIARGEITWLVSAFNPMYADYVPLKRLGWEMFSKLIFVSALLLALSLLCACKEVKHTGAAALAYDFARTGIIPGKHLASKTHVVEEQVFPGFSGMGVTSNRGANLWVIMDKNKIVTFAAIQKPGGPGDPPGSIDTDFKTQDGGTVWGFTEEQIIKLYGKPSWTYIEDANDPHVRNINYDYKVNADTVIVITFDFMMKGNKALPAESVSGGITDMEEIIDTTKGKATLYAWPVGLRRGIRKPVMEFDEEPGA
jgi:hypothetical protein